jgi:hypothetical protein
MPTPTIPTLKVPAIYIEQPIACCGRWVIVVSGGSGAISLPLLVNGSRSSFNHGWEARSA